jgi:TetR/AcrR family transcriptional regulator, transcriptional repressor for nem operon
MRYDAEHKQRTRAKVLKEAARAIRSEGPHRIGVAEVMAKAGLTHGGFYAHFTSKDDLVAAAIAQMFDEAPAAFAHVTAGKTPVEALAAYVDFYLSPRHRDAQSTGCPLPTLAADLPRLDRAARRGFTLGAERLTRALAQLIADREQRDAAAALASSALAEMVGALSLARAIADPARSNAVLKHSREAVKRRLGIAEETQDGRPDP